MDEIKSEIKAIIFLYRKAITFVMQDKFLIFNFYLSIENTSEFEFKISVNIINTVINNTQPNYC